MVDHPGPLFVGLGRSTVLSEDALFQYPARVIEPLKALRVLESFESAYWECDSCDEEHEFLKLQGKHYKACPEDPTAILKEASAADTERWQINWEKLREQFCAQNLLSPLTQGEISGVFPVGSRTGQMLFLLSADTGEKVLLKTQLLRLSYSDPELLLTNMTHCILSSAQQAALRSLKTHYLQIEDVMNSQWLLPGIPTQSNVEPILTLDPSRLTIGISGTSYTFPSAKTFLFRTAQVLVAANGAIVRHEDFESQYYKISASHRGGTSISLNGYVGRLEKLLHRNLENVLQGRTIFESIYGEGYKLRSDFVPAEILS